MIAERELDKEIISNSLPNIKSTKSAPALQETYHELFEQCRENAEIFKCDNTEQGQRIYAALLAWQDFIKLADELVTEVGRFAHKYDFDETTPGNGYRSFIKVTNSCITYGQQICKNTSWTTMFFCKTNYMKEIEACSQLLASLCTCLKYLLILHEWSSDSVDLFANGEHTAEELFELGENINQYSFYGRCLGFQYGVSIRGVLRFISNGMAGFSETFYSQTNDGPFLKTTRSIWTSGKYFLNPEMRARRIVNISQNAKVDFCKSFWFLAESELMHKIPSIVGSSIKVNQMIEIPAEPLQLPRVIKATNGSVATGSQNDNVEFVNIPVPSSHLGPGIPVSVRLLSYTRRVGMLGDRESAHGWQKLQPPANGIVLHCHGGGFVAQSSKSHEIYLRDWAQTLDVPILSVDYSLAPEAPFPRALEEVFFAYCWLIKNAKYLGTTAERIVLAGDSAGANLSLGVALRCIEKGVRPPDGLFLAYCPTLISFVPSPARLLCLMDPLLPFGFMMRCLRAYSSPEAGSINVNTNLKKMDTVRKASLSDSNFVPPTNEENIADSSPHISPVTNPKEYRADQPSWNQSQIKFKDLDDGEVVKIPNEHSTDELLTITRSHTYVTDFLKKYINDTSKDTTDLYATEEALTAKYVSEENLLSDSKKNIIALDPLKGRLNSAINGMSKIPKCPQSSGIKINERSPPPKLDGLRNMDALIARSPSVEFAFQVPKDPFLSPYWASNDWLSQLPNTKILTLDMDPCLDDCVMFAKKLKNLGRPVSLKILDGLPHGFLNFTMLSSEALEGSKHCIRCLQDLLNSPHTSVITNG